MITLSVSAQKSNDTLAAFQYFQKGNSLLLDNEIDKSIVCFEKALSIYKDFNVWERVAECYIKIGENHRQISAYDESRSNAQKALEICRQNCSETTILEALAYDLIGNYYLKNNDYKKALEVCRKGLHIKLTILPNKHLSLGRSYELMALIYEQYEDFDQALTYYEKNLEITKELRGLIHEYTANGFNNVGAILMEKGELEKALQYLEKGLSIKNELFGSSHYQISTSFINIGIVHKRMGFFDKALEYYQKAIAIRTNLYDKNHRSLIGPYHNAGLVYHNKKEYDTAISYFNKGISIILELVGDSHNFTAHSYSNFGDVYLEKGDYKKALDYFIKSHTIFKTNLGEHNTRLAIAYNFTSSAYYKNEEYHKALEYYNKAINANQKQDTVKSLQQNVGFNDFFDLMTLLESLEGKAKVLKEQFKEKGDSRKLDFSILNYQKADSVINEIRQNLHNYTDKVVFAKRTKDVYKGAIEAHMLYYDLNKNRNFLISAFRYFEKSKANTMKELLSESSAISFAGLPKETLHYEKELKRDRAFYKSKLNKEFSNKEKDVNTTLYYENELFNVSRKQDSLTEILENKFPKYYQLKYQNTLTSVEKIQQKLQKNTTMLEFFSTEDITYVCTISKNNITVKELSTPQLAQKIASFRKAIIGKNTTAYKTTAYQLYKELIVPVEDQLVGDELIIVPDGSLWHLNFELLLSQLDTSNNFKEQPYFLKKYAIAYANSATLLFSENDHIIDTSMNKEECLAFSFSENNTTATAKNMSMSVLRATGDDLPGTRKEIKAIAEIVDGSYYYGAEAIEANFKNNVNKYKILHLALHGVVDNAHPENSKLFFTKGKDTLEDNLLYSHELFTLDIPAELTVLSACNTGVGKIAKGEGIMSLGTAFQYAGTKSLLLSNWEVSDQTTPELMKNFYKNIKAGMSKSKALQQAKLKFLDNATVYNAQPFYWGGFYMIGDTAPIHFNSYTFIYWYIGLGIIAIILLSLLWYRFKINKTENQ
ncbi:CHAT domain-containing protein [Aquimarina addita]|uniref:CHAT domain-containing protein n=2 Tax=Aquimarina addita TaxID=870485 RepID=A0ABP7XI57_9FLAO